jgi:hypothetical protein
MDKKPTVTYFEKRSVNIGDYENIEFCLTLQGVQVKSKGFGNKTAEISAAENAPILDEAQVDMTIQTVVTKVQSKLNSIEKKVRMQVADWQGIGFDTEAKAVKRKLIKQEDYSNKYGDRFELDKDED